MGRPLLTVCWLLVLMPVSAAMGKPKILPPIRTQEQFNEETRVWVKAIEEVRTTGMPVSVFNDGGETTQNRLRALVGPYAPLDRVEYTWIGGDGTFGLKFRRKYTIDVPLKAGGYIRVKMGTGAITGKLEETRTVQTDVPVQLLVFKKKNSMQIDKLGPNRKSTVPAAGKLLGMLPHIICLAYLERNGEPYAAPQLDGKGAVENGQSVTDLLNLADSLPKVGYLPKNPPALPSQVIAKSESKGVSKAALELEY